MSGKRIYVAGAYSANNVTSVLDNIRIGIRYATKLMLQGDYPWCPWTDFLYALLLRENETLTVDDYYRYSMAWLEVSETLHVLPNSENSTGTNKEIARAFWLDIPIKFLTEEDL